MIIPIKAGAEIQVENIDVEEKSFKSLHLKEDQIEEFLRKNIDLILGDENLLIVGRQVTTSEKGRSDLTAIDENGNLVLIEIKRDVDDMRARKEQLEFQALRYAASYAKIKTVDDLVDKIFASYIEKYRCEFDLGDLTTHEKATRILNSFLEKNNATKLFNKKQRIILIASSFDRQTESAVAWLISNNVDISCFTLKPVQIGEGLFLEINRLLPPQMLEDFFADVYVKRTAEISTERSDSGITRTYLPRMDKLFHWDILKKGDIVVVKNFEDSDAVVQNVKSVMYKGEVMTFNTWAEKVTGWSAVNIYEWTMIKGETKTLDQKRREKMEELKLE